MSTSLDNEEAVFWRTIAEKPSDYVPRLAFADWLEKHHDERAQWLRDPELGSWMRSGDRDPTAHLLEALGSGTVDEKMLTRSFIVKVGKPAAMALIELLEHDVTAIDGWAAGTLSDFDADLLRPLLQRLIPLIPKHGATCYALAKLGPEVAVALPVLTQAYRDHKIRPYQLDMVLDAMRTPSLLADLTMQAEDADPVIRRQAAAGLGWLFLDEEEEVEDEEQPANKKDTARSLLLELLKDEIALVRAEAAKSLCEILTSDDQDAVAPLQTALKDPSDDVRASAAEAFGRLRETAFPAVPDLIEAMRDGATLVRRNAARTIDGMQRETPEMLEALIRGLDDEDLEVRHACAHGLCAWNEIYGMRDAVFTKVNDLDPAIRLGAICLFAKAKEGTAESIAFLHRLLREENDKNLRVEAAKGLGNLKVGTPEVLADLFALWDSGADIAGALLAIGPPALPGINDRLLNQPELRYGLLNRAFWDEPEYDLRTILPGLLACLNDPLCESRWETTVILERMGRYAAEALSALCAALSDADGRLRGGAVRAIATISETGADYLPEIVRLLDDAETSVRCNAIWTLGELNMDPVSRFPYLHGFLKNEDEEVRVAAFKALTRLGSAAAPAIPELIRALQDSNGSICTDAVETLGNIGPAAHAAIPALTDLLIRGDGVRYVICQTLGKLGASENAAPIIEELRLQLWSKDGDTRAIAAQTLGEMGPIAAAALPDLIRALQDPTWGDVQQETLAKHTYQGIALIPRELSRQLGSVDQRAHIALALQRIGTPAAILPALQEAALSESPLLRAVAEEIIAELQQPESD